MHRVQLGSEARVRVVTARGELDAYAAPDLTACFDELAGDGALVVDLAEVSFLDSTALGAIAKGVRLLRERSCDVRVVLPRGPARRIFELTTLDRNLPVSPSRSTALAELGEAQ